MADNYTWIFIVGIVVFFLVIIILLCFTKATGERLFLSQTDDLECVNEIVETPALLATLSEDARLSYERAKGKYLLTNDMHMESSKPLLKQKIMSPAHSHFPCCKGFQQRYPPDSIPTDITLSQYVSIQEKGVSAFEFEWDMETNSFVSARTEIQFFYGECCVQTNLPLPRNQDVYYWEAKMFEKPSTTTVAVGVSTKPYPHWRLPGWNRHSIGYFSDTGCKYFNNPFQAKPYGLGFQEGDVIGVGYRHRTGTIFFTRNGRKLEDACTGLRWNLFPTIGANGPCQVHVNLGQMGFVFVEANVKKWGLAPIQGTLAPPPAYGYEAGSLLLERGMTRRSNGTLATSSISRTSRNSCFGHDDDSDEDDDDEQPLIQINTHIPIPQPNNRRANHFPAYSPPAYSTFPRVSSFAPPTILEEAEEEAAEERRHGLLD